MNGARARISTLADAVRAHVRPGMHLHFASTPSRSNAAVREVARAFRDRAPGFVLSATGFHSMAHLLGRLRLGREYVSCFFGDNHPVPRPNPMWTELEREGATITCWSLGSYVAALRAGALGLPWTTTRSLRGSTLGADLARVGAYREIEIDGEIVGLVRAMQPDIAFVHGALADEDGSIVLGQPRSEGTWGALAATTGVIATVERIVRRGALRDHADSIHLPAHRVLAVCEEPFGAHPQGLFVPPRFGVDGYADDFEHYALWRAMTARSPARFDEFAHEVLDADDGGAAYRTFVGGSRLAALREGSAVPAHSMPVVEGTPAPPLSPVDPHRADFPDGFVRPGQILVVLAARAIVERVAAADLDVVLAGIGNGFLAARVARDFLAGHGRALPLLVETGLCDLEALGPADDFLLSRSHVGAAARLSDVEDVLGALTCGAAARCLGVLAAAQVDSAGNINSTRVDGRLLVGSGGANDVASAAREIMVLSRCSRLLPSIEHVTSPGARVRTVVTELCTFVRDDADRPWRLGAVYPFLGGRPLEEAVAIVRDQCRWSFEIPDELEYAPIISTREMMIVQRLEPRGTAWTRE